MKKGLQLYELQLDNEGKNLNHHHVIEDSTLNNLSMFERDIENLFTLENQPECQVRPQSQDPDNEVSLLI